MDECTKWLKKYLNRYGRSPAEAIITSAALKGYSRKDVRKAREELKLISSSVTYWALPGVRKNDGNTD